LQYLRSRTCDVDAHSCAVRLHAEGDHGAAERVVGGGLISRTEKSVQQKTVFSNVSEEIGVQADTDFSYPHHSILFVLPLGKSDPVFLPRTQKRPLR